MEHVDVHQVLEVRPQLPTVASVPLVGEADGLVLPVGPVHPVIVQGEAERMRQVLLYQRLQAKRMEIILNGTQRIFFENFGGHQSFLWGHWYPCFGCLVMSALSFKASVDPLFLCFITHLQLIPHIQLWCDTCSPLMVSMAAKPF